MTTTEKRLTTKCDEYMVKLKADLVAKGAELGIVMDEKYEQWIQYLYDYERLEITKDDLDKKKRAHTNIPLYDRCSAYRWDNKQCTRRRKDGSEYCGTHIKGMIHGKVEGEEEEECEKAEVWLEDISGIMCYVDSKGNIYNSADIIENKKAKKIGKYEKKDDKYVFVK